MLDLLPLDVIAHISSFLANPIDLVHLRSACKKTQNDVDNLLYKNNAEEVKWFFTFINEERKFLNIENCQAKLSKFQKAIGFRTRLHRSVDRDCYGLILRGTTSNASLCSNEWRVKTLWIEEPKCSIDLSVFPEVNFLYVNERCSWVEKKHTNAALTNFNSLVKLTKAEIIIPSYVDLQGGKKPTLHSIKDLTLSDTGSKFFPLFSGAMNVKLIDCSSRDYSAFKDAQSLHIEENFGNRILTPSTMNFSELNNASLSANISGINMGYTPDFVFDFSVFSKFTSLKLSFLRCDAVENINTLKKLDELELTFSDERISIDWIDIAHIKSVKITKIKELSLTMLFNGYKIEKLELNDVDRDISLAHLVNLNAVKLTRCNVNVMNFLYLKSLKHACLQNCFFHGEKQTRQLSRSVCVDYVNFAMNNKVETLFLTNPRCGYYFIDVSSLYHIKNLCVIDLTNAVYYNEALLEKFPLIVGNKSNENEKILMSSVLFNEGLAARDMIENEFERLSRW